MPLSEGLRVSPVPPVTSCWPHSYETNGSSSDGDELGGSEVQEMRINNQAQSPGVTTAPVDPDEIPVGGTVVMVFQGEQHKGLRMAHFVSEAAQI